MTLTFVDIVRIQQLQEAAEKFPCDNPDAGSEVLLPHFALLSHDLRVIFTKDLGHWFPNADWQNCWHLSISAGPPGVEPQEAPREHRESLVREFFSPTLVRQVCHEHRPRSAVHHYRVFFNEQGAVVVPKGEQYTRRGEKGYFERREIAKVEALSREIGR